MTLIPGFLCPSRQVSYQNSPWLSKPQGVGYESFLLLASTSGDSPFARLLDRRGQVDFLEMLKTSIREASRGLNSLSNHENSAPRHCFRRERIPKVHQMLQKIFYFC